MTSARSAGLARRFGADVADALSRATTAGRWDAPIEQGSFPLVVFQPGAAMAAGDYRLLLEDLASRGYLIMALNPEGSPAASADRYDRAANEMIEALALARSGAVNQADLGRIGLLGHSLGGAAAVMALTKMPGAAAINLDGDFQDPPVLSGGSILYLLGRTDGEGAGSRNRRADAWRTVSSGAADAVVLQVVNLRHFDFADVSLLQSGVPQDRRRARFGPIGGQAAHDLTVDLVAAFLDTRLKGESGDWLATLARHPEAAAPSTW